MASLPWCVCSVCETIPLLLASESRNGVLSQKGVLSQHRDFTPQTLAIALCINMGFLNPDNFDLLMFSSNSSSKSNFRHVFLFLRCKFDFEDELEENIRRSKLSAFKNPMFIQRAVAGVCKVKYHVETGPHFETGPTG